MSTFEERLNDGGPGVWTYLGRQPIAVVSADMQRAVDDLWPRIGQPLRDLLHAAAVFATPYTTQQLADWLELDLKTVHARRARLGRILNGVKQRYPECPSLFEEHPKPAGTWRHLLTNEAREAITCKWLQDEQDPTSPTQPPPWRA
jgi:hypothetical protein